MSGWRIFTSAFLGKLCAAFFIAVCTVLGFGPNQWAAFVISGLPFFLSPGVARLGFLLLASATLFSLYWRPILEGTNRSSGKVIKPTVRIITLAAICLPFVAGSFYITAMPLPYRHLTDPERQRLTEQLNLIKTDVPTVAVAHSYGDEPNLYAGEWEDVIEKVGISVIRFLGSADAGDCGVMVGLVDVSHPSERAQKVIGALRQAGFTVPIIQLGLRRDQQHIGIDFDLLIGPQCR